MIFPYLKLQNKTTHEIDELKHSLETTVDRLNSQSDDADKITKSLNARLEVLQRELHTLQNEYEK